MGLTNVALWRDECEDALEENPRTPCGTRGLKQEPYPTHLTSDRGPRFAPLTRTMSRARNALGEIGENLACAELERRGYAVLARRYRIRGGEIDIIASQGRTVVFV